MSIIIMSFEDNRQVEVIIASKNDPYAAGRGLVGLLTGFNELLLAELALFPFNLVDLGLEFFLGETNAGDKG